MNDFKILVILIRPASVEGGISSSVLEFSTKEAANKAVDELRENHNRSGGGLAYSMQTLKLY